MSCTHDCGCTSEIRDARTDEWVQIAPESARPATLTPEQPVKAPGQGEYSQSPSEPVFIDPSTLIVRAFTEDQPADTESAGAAYLSGPMTGLPDFNRPAFHAAAATLRAQGHVVINPAEVDLGPDATWADYMRIHLAEIARRVTQVFVLPGWESSRGAQLEVHVARALGLPVVPVLTEDKPAQEPVLPRRIEPEDVRVGMVVERRKDDAAMRDRVHLIDNALIGLTGFCLWMPEYAAVGWSLWLVEDAPEPVDPDAAAVEAIVTAYRRSPECSTHAVFGESMLDHLRAQGYDVTARAEQ